MTGAQTPTDPPRALRPAGDWMWLYPLTYAAHIADELWYGPGLPAWLLQRVGTPVSAEHFTALHAVLFVGTLVLVVLARWWWAPLILVLATVVAANGLLYLGLSVATRSLAPGLLTGVLLWLPLGLGTLRWGGARYGRHGLWRAVVSGVMVHAVIVLIVLRL